ncbi:hypothetical protein [Salibacterium salarium]|uniref:hypothetical protein n=1 Tax=Salibacterium salarium TaxID=284579 RepID=UPI00163A5C6C|nr:hypothetical protein [Salibacterium salarium]
MKKLNRYNINSHPIGKGRNAVVYVGHDPMHNRLAAIKAISSKKKANIERTVM